MTTLEIWLILILWVIIGCFICYKRDWYDSYDKQVDGPPARFVIIVAIVLMPINFLLVFFQRFFLDPWDNSNI
jgi:hypothetical protein